MGLLPAVAEGDQSKPTASSLFEAVVVRPELVAAGGDRRRKVQGVRGFQAVPGPQVSGEVEGFGLQTMPESPSLAKKAS